MTTNETISKTVVNVKKLISSLYQIHRNLRNSFFLGDDKSMSALCKKADLVIEELQKEIQVMYNMDYLDETIKAKANQSLFQLIRKADEILAGTKHSQDKV